jgi:hypothetical protein
MLLALAGLVGCSNETEGQQGQALIDQDRHPRDE